MDRWAWLTHLPLALHICVSELIGTGSGNGLSPVLHQAITWTNADLLSIGPLGTNFIEIWIKIQKFSFLKMPLKMLSAKWQPFCLGGDELINRNTKDRCLNRKRAVLFMWTPGLADTAVILTTAPMLSTYIVIMTLAVIILRGMHVICINCSSSNSGGQVRKYLFSFLT